MTVRFFVKTAAAFQHSVDPDHIRYQIRHTMAESIADKCRDYKSTVVEDGESGVSYEKTLYVFTAEELRKFINTIRHSEETGLCTVIM